MMFYFWLVFNQKRRQGWIIAYHRDEFNNLHEIIWCSLFTGDRQTDFYVVNVTNNKITLNLAATRHDETIRYENARISERLRVKYRIIIYPCILQGYSFVYSFEKNILCKYCRCWHVVVKFDDKFLILGWRLDKVRNYCGSPHFFDVFVANETLTFELVPISC